MLTKWNRRVIPRWRDSSISGAVPGEQPQSTGKISRHLPAFREIEVVELLNEWRNQKSVGGAADILNFAHIPSILPLLSEPAKYLVTLDEPISPLLKRIAFNILKTGVFSDNTSQLAIGSPSKEWHITEISRLKKNIFVNPRNAVALIDLARIYATLGQTKKANKAILVASSLYPNHKFILRSAARFFVQIGEADHALHLINNSPRTLNDPWLLASKLSIEEILGKQHRQMRGARLLAESNKFGPFQLSELRGAIASIQLASGDIKLAKKNFFKALICPNDNVVAQAKWASQNYKIVIDVRDELISGPLSSEAVFYQRNDEGDFERANEAAFLWFLDEPFSPRPLKAASFVSGILGDGKLSEEYALSGLKLDKDDIELKNNLVFALATQDKIEDAVKHFYQIIRLEQIKSIELGGHTMANCGMILYRTGYFEKAEECYRKAIEIFGKNKSNEAKGIATAFMAREAILANAPNAQKLVIEATEVVAKVKSKAGNKVLSLIGKAASVNKAAILDALSTNPEWIYDKAKNTLTVK